MKLEITSCSRPSILTSFRKTFTLELFKVLCCCCLKVFPFIAHSVVFGQKTTTTKKRRKIPFSPRKKKKMVSLGIHLFQRRTSTGSEPFSLLINLDATIFVLPIACVAGVRKGRVRELGRETTREGGGDPFSLASPTRSSPPKFPLPPCLNSYRRLAQKIVQNYGSRVQKAHVRLTCVAQKHRC